ncbi:MAG: S28 family serine protease [Phocaeicola sp.]|uniref:S28 family serine protease n=2 Tax=Phocaeicola sp. TaxID=2773926 RepID=UPI003F9FD010
MRSIKFGLLFVLAMVCSVLSAQNMLKDKLSTMSEIKEFKPLESTVFPEKYVTYFVQPIDHKNPAMGTFTQRVYVMHRGFDRPTVIVTEGYGAMYAERPKYEEEISKLYNTNLIVVEYRYFLESTPQPKDWKYLTVEQSVDDLHAVRNAFKAIYPNKWIATGISKGGQTTMFYRTFYPDDVDISVPYVAPLNYGIEDGRHEPFINNVSTAEDRKKVQDFQLEVLKRRATLQPMFDEYIADKKLSYPVPLDELYDYCVLEYSFAIWQWGVTMDKIPAVTASDKEIFDHWMKQSDPSNFNREGYFKSFFVQAAKELGYYGYDTKPFKKYLRLKSAKGWVNRLMLPDELKGVKFDKAVAQKVTKFLKENDPKMIYIYGSIDPWSASGVFQWLDLKHKKNLHIFVQDGGCHATRIGTMPEKEQTQIKNLLNDWLNE